MADTMTFTTTQHGAYLLLLMAYWRQREPLPDDDEALRSITKTSRSEWKALRPTLARKFRVADGVWWHKRVEAEIAEAEARAKKASEKASKAAQARWQASDGHASGSAPSMPQALHEDCPTPSPTPSASQSSSPPSGEKKARKRADPVLPDWLPADTWAQFVTHRKAMRGVPFTDAARDGVLRELGKLRDAGHDPAELLTTAIVRGWRTVFPPKPGTAAPIIPINRQEAQEARNRAVGEAWLREQEAADASR